jgi:hypothetical protein
VGDAVTRVVVLGGIIVAVATLLLVTSLRRGLRFPELTQPGPVARVVQSYAAAVSFAAVLIGSVSLVIFLYEAIRILAPGVFELAGSRVDAARVLVSALYLTLASAAIVALHGRLLPLGQWTARGTVSGGVPETQLPPPPSV